MATFYAAVVFKDGGTPTRQGIHPLPRGRGLARALSDFAGERMLPPIPKLLEALFWLDPSDPHKMAAVSERDTPNIRPLRIESDPCGGACKMVWFRRFADLPLLAYKLNSGRHL